MAPTESLEVLMTRIETVLQEVLKKIECIPSLHEMQIRQDERINMHDMEIARLRDEFAELKRYLGGWGNRAWLLAAGIAGGAITAIVVTRFIK